MQISTFFILREIQSILRSISEGNIENNYFLIGSQLYFINLICKKLEENINRQTQERK